MRSPGVHYAAQKVINPTSLNSKGGAHLASRRTVSDSVRTWALAVVVSAGGNTYTSSAQTSVCRPAWAASSR